MRDQTSYTSWSVAWDIENMSDENMLQDTEIISVILAFQKCRGLQSENRHMLSTVIFLSTSSSQVTREICVKKHNELDAVVEMLIRKILTQQIDKICWENVTNCHILEQIALTALTIELTNVPYLPGVSCRSRLDIFSATAPPSSAPSSL